MNFLTPDSSDFLEAQECRTITLPAPLWPLVNGALERLTAVYNWDAQGDATPAECVQFFIGVIDSYNLSKCAEMGTVETTFHALVNNQSYTQSGQIFTIDHSQLPVEAQGAKMLSCWLQVNHNVANQIIQMNKKDGNAIVYSRFTTPSINHRASVIIPMDADGAQVRSLSANGTAVVLSVYLVGWWK